MCVSTVLKAFKQLIAFLENRMITKEHMIIRMRI